MSRVLAPSFRLLATIVLVTPVREARAQRRITAVKTTSVPVIDGRLDDARWKQAATATGFSMFARPEQPHPEQTISRACFDDDYLHISLQCRVAEIDTFRARLEKSAGSKDVDVIPTILRETGTQRQ